jgi:hypothetical protein
MENNQNIMDKLRSSYNWDFLSAKKINLENGNFSWKSIKNALCCSDDDFKVLYDSIVSCRMIGELFAD